MIDFNIMKNKPSLVLKVSLYIALGLMSISIGVLSYSLSSASYEGNSESSGKVGVIVPLRENNSDYEVYDPFRYDIYTIDAKYFYIDTKQE